VFIYLSKINTSVAAGSSVSPVSPLETGARRRLFFDNSWNTHILLRLVFFGFIGNFELMYFPQNEILKILLCFKTTTYYSSLYIRLLLLKT
jgi:hypothetical protein